MVLRETATGSSSCWIGSLQENPSQPHPSFLGSRGGIAAEPQVILFIPDQYKIVLFIGIPQMSFGPCGRLLLPTFVISPVPFAHERSQYARRRPSLTTVPVSRNGIDASDEVFCMASARSAIASAQSNHWGRQVTFTYGN